MYSLTKLPNQQIGEHGIELLRRHFFTFFLVLLGYVFLALLPIPIILILGEPISEILAGNASRALLVVFLSTYYLAVITFLFHSFMDFYLDVWVVTNERILAIEQKGLFSRVIAEQKLFRVQDVTSEVHGFFSTILKYGNLYIQTAGQAQRFVFKDIPRPEAVVKEIHDAAYVCKMNHGHAEAKAENV